MLVGELFFYAEDSIDEPRRRVRPRVYLRLPTVMSTVLFVIKVSRERQRILAWCT
jgi:hypothetical protein